jgi:hypothetical protein
MGDDETLVVRIPMHREIVGAIAAIAERRGITRTEVNRQAHSLNILIEEVFAEDPESFALAVRRHDGTWQTLVFPWLAPRERDSVPAGNAT